MKSGVLPTWICTLRFRDHIEFGAKLPLECNHFFNLFGEMKAHGLFSADRWM